jgi:ATP phosphoribosyltransferase
LPKGRLLPRLEALLERVGLRFPEPLTRTRRLVLEAENGREALGTDLEVLLLKNADVPVYVEHGVAELGASGTDLLYESGLSVYRPYTFAFGGCDVVLAARKEHDLDHLKRRPSLRVATKYVRYARDYFARVGWTVEIIPLSGSVELAPVLGLADAIVDLTETGKTLRDNGLAPVARIGKTYFKLIANRALAHSTSKAVERLIDAFRAVEGETS